MNELQGRRIADGSETDDAQPGDYWKPPEGRGGGWWIRDPFGKVGRIITHTVEEHEDGTITVSPSIACAQPGKENFHGWLKKGVWTW